VIMRRSGATPSVTRRLGRRATPNAPERSPYPYHNHRPGTPAPAPRHAIAEHLTRSGATPTGGRLAGGSAEAVTAAITLQGAAPAQGGAPAPRAAHGSHPTHPFHALVGPRMGHAISDIYGTYDHMPVRSHAGTLDALRAPSALIGHFTHRSAPITVVEPKLAAHCNMPDTY